MDQSYKYVFSKYLHSNVNVISKEHFISEYEMDMSFLVYLNLFYFMKEVYYLLNIILHIPCHSSNTRHC